MTTPVETKGRLLSSERDLTPMDKVRGARETANARPDERAVAERLVEELLAQWGCPDGDIAEAHNALLAHFDQVRNSADAEIAKVMAERDELREDVALLQEQLDGASPFIKGLRSELAYLRSNTAALEAQIASTKQALAAIKSQDTHRTSAQDK